MAKLLRLGLGLAIALMLFVVPAYAITAQIVDSPGNVLNLNYDNTSKSYVDAGLNKNSYASICGVAANNYVGYVYLANASYVQINSGLGGPFGNLLRILSVNGSSCAKVDLDFSTLTADYPGIPAVVYSTDNTLSSGDTFLQLSKTDGWLTGNFTVDYKIAGSNLNVSVTKVLDGSGNQITPKKPYIALGLKDGSGNIVNSSIVQPGQYVLFQKPSNFSFVVNGVDIGKTECAVGQTLCQDGTCSSNCAVTDSGAAGCIGAADSVCDVGEGCACSDCLGQQDSCGTNLVCTASSVCGLTNCSVGQALCQDGTCSANCAVTDSGNAGCFGTPNSVCSTGEGCACIDCYGQQDSCNSGLICDRQSQTCETYDCGNGICDTANGETSANCAADCGAPAITGAAFGNLTISEWNCTWISTYDGTAAPGKPIQLVFYHDCTVLREVDLEFNALVIGARIKTFGNESVAAPPSKPTGTVISYFKFEHNIPENKFSNVLLQYKVSKANLAAKGFVADDVTLRKLTDNGWITLSTSLVSEDNDYYFFESASGSLSLFAIVAEKGAPSIIPPVVIPPVILPGVEKKFQFPVIPLTFAILLILMIVALGYRYATHKPSRMPKARAIAVTVPVHIQRKLEQIQHDTEAMLAREKAEAKRPAEKSKKLIAKPKQVAARKPMIMPRFEAPRIKHIRVPDMPTMPSESRVRAPIPSAITNLQERIARIKQEAEVTTARLEEKSTYSEPEVMEEPKAKKPKKAPKEHKKRVKPISKKAFEDIEKALR